MHSSPTFFSFTLLIAVVVVVEYLLTWGSVGVLFLDVQQTNNRTHNNEILFTSLSVSAPFLFVIVINNIKVGREGGNAVFLLLLIFVFMFSKKKMCVVEGRMFRGNELRN